MKILSQFSLFLALSGVTHGQGPSQPLPEVEHLHGLNYLFSWETVPGRVYFIQTSSQLSEDDGFAWRFAPDIRVGDGTRVQMGFLANADHAEFFRIVYVDYNGSLDPNLADFDDDGFTNLEEATENSDPFDPDSFPVGDPGDPGNPGDPDDGPPGGGGGDNAPDWVHPWEYSLTYSLGDVVQQHAVNPMSPPQVYRYPMGNMKTTRLEFQNQEGMNTAPFLQAEPDVTNFSASTNGDLDILGVVELSEAQPTWEHVGEDKSYPDGLMLPIEVLGIDDTVTPPVVGDISSGVDTTSRKAESNSIGYTKDYWIMAPAHGNKVRMFASSEVTIQNVSFSLDSAVIQPAVFNDLPKDVTIFPNSFETVEHPMKVSFDAGTPQALPVQVKIMKSRTLDVQVHPIALLIGDQAHPPEFLPTKEMLETYLNRVFKEQLNLECGVTIRPAVEIDWDVKTKVDFGPFDFEVPPHEPRVGDRILEHPKETDLIKEVSPPKDALGTINVYLVGGLQLMRKIALREGKLFVFEEFYGVNPVTDTPPFVCFVDGVRSTDAPDRRSLTQIMNTVAHEIGHTLLADGHPDEGTGPAPLDVESDHSKRLMASGARRQLGIQLVKKEWDEADGRMSKVIDLQND